MHGKNYSYHIFIFLHDNLPRTEGTRYTRFTNHQLQLLHELLKPTPLFMIGNRKCHCSSEEAFIIIFFKLVTGGTNLGLQYLFGECNVQRILDIYSYTIWLLDDKAQGLFHQPCLEQWKDNFPARVIE
jgi:hypothetical protein